jgi:hypothetical protein
MLGSQATDSLQQEHFEWSVIEVSTDDDVSCLLMDIKQFILH